MNKAIVIGYIIFIFLLLFEINQMIVVKKQVDKRVEGIKTQIEKIHEYERELSEF